MELMQMCPLPGNELLSLLSMKVWVLDPREHLIIHVETAYPLLNVLTPSMSSVSSARTYEAVYQCSRLNTHYFPQRGHWGYR